MAPHYKPGGYYKNRKGQGMRCFADGSLRHISPEEARQSKRCTAAVPLMSSSTFTAEGTKRVDVTSSSLHALHTTTQRNATRLYRWREVVCGGRWWSLKMEDLIFATCVVEEL